jgi:hypothetical protein
VTCALGNEAESEDRAFGFLDINDQHPTKGTIVPNRIVITGPLRRREKTIGVWKDKAAFFPIERPGQIVRQAKMWNAAASLRRWSKIAAEKVDSLQPSLRVS